MALSSRPYANRYIPSSRFPIGLRWLLIVNIAIFVFTYFSKPLAAFFLDNFALVPAQAVQGLAIWQIVTYMFLHFGIGPILWNMLALWMFGAELERIWGTARFLRFYFLSGIFTALTMIVLAYALGSSGSQLVGSSGAVLAILMAYAVLFPDRTLLFGFLFPMKTKYFVMIIAALVLFESYHGGIAVFAQLGGLVSGYLMLRGRSLQTRMRRPVVSGYQQWKLRRAKKKFEVYLRKQNSNHDRWVH